MNKRQIKKQFLSKLESELPEIEVIKIDKKVKSNKWKICLSILVPAALALIIIPTCILLNQYDVTNTPYYNSILSKITSSSQCEVPYPDFKRELEDERNSFYRIKRSYDVDDEGKKVGLYLPKEKAREAEARCKVSSLLNSSAFNGITYYSALNYIKYIRTFEFSKKESIPFIKNGLELVGLYGESKFTIEEDLLSDKEINLSGTYFSYVYSYYDGDKVIERGNSSSREDIYVSRLNFSKEENLPRFNGHFYNYNYQIIGNIKDENFLYDAGFYCKKKDYSIPELDSSSTAISEYGYTIPYIEFKKILSKYASYYRTSKEIESAGNIIEFNSPTLDQGEKSYLISSKDEIKDSLLNLDLLAKYDETFFKANSLVLYSLNKDYISIGAYQYQYLMRKGDNLIINITQEKSYEKKHREILLAIEVKKEGLSNKSKGQISLEITLVEPKDSNLLNTYTLPYVMVKTCSTKDGFREGFELTSFSISKDKDSHNETSLTLCFDSPIWEANLHTDNLSVEKLVKNGKVITAFLKLINSENLTFSKEKYAKWDILMIVESDYIGDADKILLNVAY